MLITRNTTHVLTPLLLAALALALLIRTAQTEGLRIEQGWLEPNTAAIGRLVPESVAAALPTAFAKCDSQEIASVSILVMDDHGRPIANAKVTATPASEGDMAGEQQVVTGRDGSCSIDVPSVSIGIYAETQTGLSTPIYIIDSPPPSEEALWLRASHGGGWITGVVRSPSGEPAPGARVSYSIDGGTWNYESIYSNRLGEFQFRRIERAPSGVLEAEWHAKFVRIPARGSMPNAVVRFDTPQIAAQGRVSGPDGQPIAGVRIDWWEQGAPDNSGVAYSDNSGNFSIRAWQAESPLNLRLRHSQYIQVGTWTHDLPRTGEQALPHMRMWPTAAVVGRVLDPKGRPAPNAQVTASVAEEWVGNQRVATALTDTSGCFSIEGLPQNVLVSITAAKSEAAVLGYYGSQPIKTRIEQGSETTLSLEYAEEHCRLLVVDKGTSQPITEVQVQSIQSGSPAVLASRLHSSTGEYSIASALGGEYTVRIRAPNFIDNFQATLPGDRAQPLRIEMLRAADIEVIVRDEHGESIPGASVRLGRHRVSVADKRGRCVFYGIGPGHTVIQAVFEDKESLPIEIETGTTSDISLEVVIESN